jgi:dTDP-4-amino-4,6-dideoxygalactose transaminase
VISLSEPKCEYRELKTEIDAAIQDVCAAGNYILGPNVKAFEKEMAVYCDCPHAVGVANGTDALHLALRALRVGPGDEVITTPFTFVATTEAIGIVGATPVFVDIDPHTFNIDVNKINAAITPRTKCILPVHLYGQPCDMDPIMEIARRHGLLVLEDCAQAIGAKYKGRTVGTIGDAGCLSFFPSKNLGCLGDGGMVITRDATVFERVEMLRRHGGKIKYHHEELGLNSRLDELQAAVLRIKLKSLPRWTERRREAAYHYNALLHSLLEVTAPSEWTRQGYLNSTRAGENQDLYCVYHQYTVVVRNRDAVMAAFKQADIGCAVYYPIPLHLQAVHANLGLKRGTLPESERAADHCLSLPMSPFLTEQQQQVVASTLATHSARRAA